MFTASMLFARSAASIRQRPRYVRMQREIRKAIAQLSRRQRKAGAPKDEGDCFVVCEECGQAVDRRSAAQVFHHGEPEHAPLSEAELTELSLAETEWLRPRV